MLVGSRGCPQIMIRIDCRGVSTKAPAKPRQIREACDCFVRHGYAVLDHVIAPAKVRSLRAEFDETRGRFLRDGGAKSLKVGANRHMHALPLAGAFADPLVYANPSVIALVRDVLGEDAILEAFGAIVSLPGAEAQPAHRDGPPLFSSQISMLLPPHALTFAFSLIEMNESHGTTAFWPGSHRWKTFQPNVPSQQPTLPIGSCLLWDFRLYHSGTANRSRVPRPMIYATYARRWYQDPVNFKKKALQRLVFGPEFLAGLSRESRPLLAHMR